MRDLQMLGRVTPLDRPFLDQLGCRLLARATTSTTPITGRPWSLVGRWARPAIASGLALALILTAGGVSTDARTAEGLPAKVQQVVQTLAAKLGTPEDRIEVERLGDGRFVIHLPKGGKILIEGGQAKAVAAPPSTRTEGKLVLDVTGIAIRVLGTSPEQLKSDLRERSLTEVAQEHGVAPRVLVDAIRAEVQAQAPGITSAKLETIVNEVMT